MADLSKGWVDRWKGCAIVCLASGPSLTLGDVETVHAAGLPTIITNTTFRSAPWADVLVGNDHAFWNEYMTEIDIDFNVSGARVTMSHYASPGHGIVTLHGQPWFRHFYNSGANALSLAIAGGAATVIALGFDCMKSPAGKLHHHANHPKPLSNCRSLKTWPAKFAQVAKYAKQRDCRIINCSRNTILPCFERMSLEDALALEAV